MAKFCVCVLVMLALLLACTAASARDKTPIALSVGVFYPSDSGVQDVYDDSWTLITLRTFVPEKSTEWHFSAEAGFFNLDAAEGSGAPDATLIPVSFGVERALNEKPNLQPYVALRGGPFYGDVEDSHIGLNLNASIGVTISKRFFLEARYDFFSEIEDLDFSGFSITGGVKLFEL